MPMTPETRAAIRRCEESEELRPASVRSAFGQARGALKRLALEVTELEWSLSEVGSADERREGLVDLSGSIAGLRRQADKVKDEIDKLVHYTEIADRKVREVKARLAGDG